MERQRWDECDNDEPVHLTVETSLHTPFEEHNRIDGNGIDVFVRKWVTQRLILFSYFVVRPRPVITEVTKSGEVRVWKKMV